MGPPASIVQTALLTEPGLRRLRAHPSLVGLEQLLGPQSAHPWVVEVVQTPSHWGLGQTACEAVSRCLARGHLKGLLAAGGDLLLGQLFKAISEGTASACLLQLPLMTSMCH